MKSSRKLASDKFPTNNQLRLLTLGESEQNQKPDKDRSHIAAGGFSMTVLNSRGIASARRGEKSNETVDASRLLGAFIGAGDT
jgi:hypothetical protein